MSEENELIKQVVLRQEKTAFISGLFVVLAGYIGTTLWLNAIRQSAALWFVWGLIALQLLFYGSIFVACSIRAAQCGHRHAFWLFVVLAVASRVNDWEVVLIPAMAVIMLVLSERNQKVSAQRQHLLSGAGDQTESEMSTFGLSALSPNELKSVLDELRKGNREAAIRRIAEIQEQKRADLLVAGVDVRAMTPEIGRDIAWTDIVRHVFRVLQFDRDGTIIGPGDTVTASSSIKPYGYLLAESPILNQSVRLPITHRDDFLLADSVFDGPHLVAAVSKEKELLVTYVPRHKLPKGLAGMWHALHYVITPRGTLDRYYEVGNDMHMRSPAPEKIFGSFVWQGEIRVQVNPHPEV